MKEITDENIYSQLLDYAENNLTEEECKALEDYIDLHPEYKELYIDYDSNITIPMQQDKSMKKYLAYSDEQCKREQLEHLLNSRRILRIATVLSSVAACVLLILLLIKPEQPKDTSKQQYVTKESKTINDILTEYITDTVYVPLINEKKIIVKDTVYIANPMEDVFKKFDEDFKLAYANIDDIFAAYSRDWNNPDYIVMFGQKDSVLGLARMGLERQAEEEYQIINISNHPNFGRPRLVYQRTLVEKQEPTIEELEKLKKKIQRQIDSLKSQQIFEL